MYSSHWYRRRTRSDAENQDAGARAVRDQFLWAGQCHQGGIAGHAEEQLGAHYDINRYKSALSVSLSVAITLNKELAGHLGTPGLGMYCASGWALEGFCDSLAYEIAPFNIKMTIVQPTMEIGILTNKIVSAPSLPQYAPENNSSPLFRGIIGGLLDRIEGPQQKGSHAQPILASDQITSLYPKLPADMKASLLAETIHAITAIGGHENPPARHIVGHEGVASVKEKLKTVSEELEDFVEASCAVDIDDDLEGSERTNSSIAQ